MNVLVDPIVLALPCVGDGPAVLDRFINNVFVWRDEIGQERHDFVTSWACVQSLMDEDCYVQEYTLRPLMAELGVSEYDARDVARVFRGFVDNLPYFEDRIDISAMMVDPDLVSINPDLPNRLLERTTPRPGVANALRETLGYAAYAKEVTQDPFVEDLLLLSVPLTTQLDSVSVDVTVHMDLGDQCLHTDLPLVAARGDLLVREDWKDIWEDTDRAIDRAQELLVRERRLRADKQRFSYTIAPTLNESIVNFGYQNRPDILEQIFWEIAELLTERENPRDSPTDKPIRGLSVITSDATGRSWTPRRRHVRRGAQAIRLHYWWADKHFIISEVKPRNAPMGICSLPQRTHTFGH